MGQTVTGLFSTFDEGRGAVQELEAAGVPHGDISLLASNARGEHGGLGEVRAEKAGEDAGKGAGVGAALGGVGGLLAGLGMMVIPGLGPVVAAGWLASTAVGALVGGAVGAAAGGLVGALTQEGVPEADAHVYAEGVRRGGALVTARVDDAHVPAAKTILREGRSVDVARRGAAYREDGWTGFDADAAPYTPDQVEIERQRYVR